MLPVSHGKGNTEVPAVHEVTQQEGGTPALDDLGEVLHGLPHVGMGALGLEVEQFAYDEQDMLASLLGRNELLDAVAEEDYAYLVIVLNGAEGQGGCYLRHHVALHLGGGTEIETAAHIDEEHDGEFALFLKDLDVGLVEACGDVPLYVAYVVAKLIFTYLAEGHSPTLEGRMVFSGKDVGGEATCLDFNLTDAF